jgi:hypothetical protein
MKIPADKKKVSVSSKRIAKLEEKVHGLELMINNLQTALDMVHLVLKERHTSMHTYENTESIRQPISYTYETNRMNTIESPKQKKHETQDMFVRATAL